jgi:hypothetical protein
MALLPTNKEKKKKIGAADIEIADDINVELGKSKYTAKDRRPVQVDPPVLKKKSIRDLSYAKDKPMYDIVALAMDALIDTLSEEERNIYNRRIKD